MHEMACSNTTFSINGHLIHDFDLKPDLKEFTTLFKSNLLSVLMLPTIHVEQQKGLISRITKNPDPHQRSGFLKV